MNATLPSEDDPASTSVAHHLHTHCQTDNVPSTAGEDEGAVEDTECPDLSPHGEGSPARGEPSSSSSSAKFWEALLKEKHEQLLKEEEQQVREQWQTSHLRHVDTSPALDAAGELLHLSHN